jgi:hypothetical protein
MAEKRPKGDRGGGIHVRRGDFRIRDFSISFDATTGELLGSTGVSELRTDIFDHWLRIAEQASDDSQVARRVAVDAPSDDAETFNKALEREFRAAMITIAASAFALDAFYASVLEHAAETWVKAESRDARIFETLKRAFALTSEQQDAAREPLRVLFRLRDEAVHPPATWAEAVLHPVFNVGMEPRFVKYRAENADNAQLLARKLIYLCLRKPKTKYANLVSWCEALKYLVPEPPPRSEENEKPW